MCCEEGNKVFGKRSKDEIVHVIASFILPKL